MIDAHIHVVPPRLPGVGPLSPLLNGAPDALAEKLRGEMQAAGVDHALAMGCWRGGDDDPLGVAETLQLAARVPGLHAIGIADPTRTDAGHLTRVEAALATGRVRALKGYLGYLHFPPDHSNYVPYFELAARFRIPFVFHTGDTYSPCARLRFAQPLLIDDMAVAHPDVRIVMAHMGNPWLQDAAEVICKNINVWADLSGLVVGDESAFSGAERQDALSDLRHDLQRAFRYAERPYRFLFGSDWPLAPMAACRDFIRTVIPEINHEQVFDSNARRLFGL